MPIRDLTEKEMARLMSQSEVDALPTGSIVMIKWVGGNGPYPYTIIQQDGKAFVAATLRGEIFQPTERIYPVGDNNMQCHVFRIQ